MKTVLPNDQDELCNPDSDEQYDFEGNASAFYIERDMNNLNLGDSVLTVSPTNASNMTTVSVSGVPIKVCVDSGCKYNIIDTTTYNKIKTVANTKLMHTDIKLFPYMSQQPLPITGKFHAGIETPNEIYRCNDICSERECNMLTRTTYSNNTRLITGTQTSTQSQHKL